MQTFSVIFCFCLIVIVIRKWDDKGVTEKLDCLFLMETHSFDLYLMHQIFECFYTDSHFCMVLAQDVNNR